MTGGVCDRLCKDAADFVSAQKKKKKKKIYFFGGQRCQSCIQYVEMKATSLSFKWDETFEL